MGSALAGLFGAGDKFERRKFLLLTVGFFCVIAGYTIAKELKDSIFVAIVGKDYIPTAKLLAFFVLIPVTMLYSIVVDKVRRYQLLCIYSVAFGLMGVIFAYLLGHPVVGLPNTDTSWDRWFGWAFYFFVEGYSPFVVSVFWAFANSISSADGAKKNYAVMVAGSKVGGMLSAGLAILFLSWRSTGGALVYSDAVNHQILLVFSSLFLLVVPISILYMMRVVPGQYLHGQEAVYQVEKQRMRDGKESTGVFAGLKMFVQYPYVLGIFSMIFFYEVINTILSYQRIDIAMADASSLTEGTCNLLKISIIVHFVGFILSFFGTRWLLRVFGERLCLMLIPALTGIALILFMVGYNRTAVIWVFVLLRVINYAFSYPVRESLYIPTVKEMKFKSKSWIDTFGTKIAKVVGSGFNTAVVRLAPAAQQTAQFGFFGVIVFSWLGAAWLLGKRYEYAVKNNEVIGVDPETLES